MSAWIRAVTGSVRSLRHYEEQGLFTSTRSAGGQRHYTDDGIERVAFIRRLYAAGPSSRTVIGLLPCVDSPSDDNSDAAMERMVRERDRLSAHIEELQRTRDVLDVLMIAAQAHRDARRAVA